MTQQKWFYPAQKVISKYLKEKYTGHDCNYQDVCKFTVHENYRVWSGGTWKDIHVVIHKPPTKVAPGVIRIFGEREDDLQYSQE